MSEKILAGRYEILEKIGDGGMAVVYKGRDRLLNRFVAIKILRPEYTRDSVFVENFRKESQAAARLSHPGIVNVHDVGREEDIYYIVMELIEGKTLSDVIEEEGRLDYKRAIRLAKQVASALSLAHKNNIIHRDVKPHNILIMPDGSAKITDFGIAKAVSDATIVDAANEAIMGSVHYFSPEQARGGYVDEKSDIYSLGIVLYEMLTGKVPFDADNPVTVAVMHMNDKPAPPSQLVSNVPPGLEQIVMKAIEKYQINRFKTADDMYEALDNVDFVTGIIENPEVMEKIRERSEEAAANGGGGNEDSQGDRGNAMETGKGKKGKDGKNKGDEGKKSYWKIRLLAVGLALLCALPASYFIYSALMELSGTGRTYAEVSVPHLVGMPEDEARRLAEGMGLELGVVDYVPSEQYEQGVVVSQERPEGSTVKEGYKILVNVSRGEPAAASGGGASEPDLPRTIPYLLGKTQEDALYTIEMYGYVLGSLTYRQDKVTVGSVVSQDPEAGTGAESGSRINLVISEGLPETVTVAMPNLVGMAEASARKALDDKGLTVGAVTEDTASTLGAGLVTSQQYSADVQVPQGSAVDFKVSSGPAAPSDGALSLKTVSIPIDFSLAETEVFPLSVMLRDSGGNSIRIINRETRFKSAGGESVSITGSGDKCLVFVYFSDVLVRTFGVDFYTGDVTEVN
ncbi:MAG: Stk1 family PASTA domain-containing Ser/Thr kinase [Clostridiales Family XIII bacterium]|jgi:serine/threonine-protein kinase|nr:Stk1 family PASTA domain-containing Ser/Thr kinase [Clostridiales Family XIII bacterium]